MRVQRYKGTRDLSPEEMTRFRLIEAAFRERCLRWGYAEVRTPTLEYLHLFTSAGTLTPSRLNRVYSFLDWDGWSGERVVLRPDGTIPTARLYIDSMAGLARLFYVANVFIFEETGQETRERWQCGAELIGLGSALADIELIALALDVLEGLGVQGVGLRLSHAGLIRALLAKLGLSLGGQARLFDRILDGDAAALAGMELVEPELREALSALLDLKGKSSGFFKNLKSHYRRGLPELGAPLDDFISVIDQLEALDCDYDIDLASGRGFEYYTGVMFQLFMGEENVGGGGRYDALVPLLGGEDIPASGFALYLDRLMSLVGPEFLAGSSAQKILLKVKPGAVKAGLSVAKALRGAGYVAELDLAGQEPDNLKWTLDVQEKAPLLVLTDRVGGKKFELKTDTEVLALLGGVEGADKDSPA